MMVAGGIGRDRGTVEAAEAAGQEGTSLAGTHGSSVEATGLERQGSDVGVRKRKSNVVRGTIRNVRVHLNVGLFNSKGSDNMYRT